MRIVELQPRKNGAHRNQTSATPIPIPQGWAEIPEEMGIPDSFPFVDVEAENGMVTKLTAREVPLDNNPKIEELKRKLADTDYAVIKIAEGVATVEEYADTIAQRQAWRNEIHTLESEET